MKIIDLLNKIANGEIPKKIKYNNVILSYDKEKEDYYRYYGEYLFDYLFGKDILDFLNDEVEIIEEEKKIPEKIDLYEETQNIIRENNYKLVYHDIHKCIVSLECKYNQLIDYLKSKGE